MHVSYTIEKHEKEYNLTRDLVTKCYMPKNTQKLQRSNVSWRKREHAAGDGDPFPASLRKSPELY